MNICYHELMELILLLISYSINVWDYNSAGITLRHDFYSFM